MRQLLPVGIAISLVLLQLAAYANGGVADRYAKSDDLREFVESRASSPKDGSYFYSYWARWECADDGGVARRISREVIPALASPQGRETAVQLRRCRNLSGPDVAVASQLSDAIQGKTAGDHLFGKFNGRGNAWIDITDPGEVQRALSMMNASEDPNVLWVISQQLATAASAGYLSVAGDKLSDLDRQSLYVAVLLSACELSVNCGPSHRWMRTWCIQNAECEDNSIEAYWRRRHVEDNANRLDWESIYRFRKMVVAAARSGDWSAFSVAVAK